MAVRTYYKVARAYKPLLGQKRFTICNMAIEAGAKNGIFPVDEVTLEYMKDRFKREPKIYTADEGAEYEKVIDIDSKGALCRRL